MAHHRTATRATSTRALPLPSLGAEPLLLALGFLILALAG